MPTITATEIIQRALFLANVWDPEEEVPNSFISAGLDALNDIIEQWCSLGIYIPYTTTITLDLTQGNYQFTVAPTIAEFLEGNVLNVSENLLSPLRAIDIYEFNRINLNSPQDRPQLIYISPDRTIIDVTTQELATTVYFSPPPDQAYTATLRIKQRILAFELFTDIASIPPFYQRALRYELASELSDIYETDLSPKFILKHQQLIKQLKAAIPKDLHVNNTNPFLSWRRYRPWGNTYGG